MIEEPIPFEKQIFVCTNDRQGEKPSCGDQAGEAVFKALRQMAKDRQLHPRIRVAQAKCLGKCTCGVNVMVYPDNAWYKNVTVETLDHIIEKYLQVDS